MATWNNGKLTVYHGTDDRAFSGSIKLGLCRPFTDFGQGLYTTTNLHQAKQWANKRVRPTLSSSSPRSAMVYKFEIDRDELAGLDTLVFVRPSHDFWSFVTACRRGRTGLRAGAIHHGRDPKTAYNRLQIYDVVFGLVTLWPQKLIISDCDQISFHTSDAINLLSSPIPYMRPGRGHSF